MAECPVWRPALERPDQAGVDAQLATKGWTKVEAGGDATISAVRITQDQKSLETVYDGFREGWDGADSEGPDSRQQALK